MNTNKKALFGMGLVLLLADILFVGWTLVTLHTKEQNIVYEHKNPVAATVV